MWSPLSWITGSSKAADIVDKTTTSIFSGIDKLVFTDEEKADYNKQAAKIYLEHQKVTLGENTAKSITRRILAVMIIGTFLSFLIFGVGAYRYDPEWSKFALQTAGTLSIGFTAIIIFYYGYYAAGNLMDKRK